ncbi:ABC transporter permease subunit, partial [Rhizobium ruizarguesonis]
IGFLVFWQVSSTRGWVNPAIFPPLDVILSALWTNLANGALLDDIAISLQRSGTAFAFAVVIGIPLGIAAARRPWVYAAMRPVLDLMQTIPTFVYLIPALILFGLGMVPGLIATVIF